MANLNSVAELAWLQLYPHGSDEAAVTKEEFIETARLEAAYQLLLLLWKERREFGFFNIPTYLLSEKELEVVNDEMDISSLRIHRSFPSDLWLAQVGGLTCGCEYVRMDLNVAQLMCDDDSLADDARTYIVVGNKIKFPLGVHKNPLPVIYANRGENLIEIDDAIAGIVRVRLIEIYGNKTGKEDVTNDSNSNQ